MLIVSDGEDHGSTVAQSISAAHGDGVRVYTAGAGTAEGAVVLDPDQFTGEPLPRVAQNGQPVRTKLDAAALQAMAQAADGRYVELSGDGRPLSVLASEFATLAPTTFGVRHTRDRVERFQVFVGIALALVLAETLLPWVLRQRRRGFAVMLRRALPLAASGLFAGAICGGGIAAINRAGNRAYDRGDYAAAIEQYQRGLAVDTGHNELHYNIGNALDRQAQYDNAVDEAKRSLPAGSSELTDKIEYSVGNHSAGAGKLQDALEAYKRALLANPDDADAKHNLEIIESRLNPTPTPSPSPTPSEEPAGGTGTPPANATPDSSGTSAGTPSAQGSPNPGSPGPDVNQSLEEALRGIDKDFTEADALRVLDLLDQANQQELGPQPPGNGRLPDF
jgi:Ca-activated chloride channel family protein